MVSSSRGSPGGDAGCHERDDFSSLSIRIASTMYTHAICSVSLRGYGPDGSGVARYLIRCYGCVREPSEEPRDRPGCARDVETAPQRWGDRLTYLVYASHGRGKVASGLTGRLELPIHSWSHGCDPGGEGVKALSRRHSRQVQVHSFRGLRVGLGHTHSMSPCATTQLQPDRVLSYSLRGKSLRLHSTCRLLHSCLLWAELVHREIP